MKTPKIPYWYLLMGPTMLFAFGFFCNAVVMGINNGPMPVHFVGCENNMIAPDDTLHSCMTSATHLKILADWIVIKSIGVASIGDLFEWASDLTIMPCLFAWFALVIRDANNGTN